jgi:hypothetical protein
VVELTEYALPDGLADDHVLVRNTFGAEKHGMVEAFDRKYGNERGAWDAKRLMYMPGKRLAWAISNQKVTGWLATFLYIELSFRC